jgi:hypothetical protein
MSARQRPLDWVAPLLVGTSAAVAAEVAIAMLIYAADGFLRSLTTVLAVEGLALGMGLWAAPAPHPELVDHLRRRWMWCLVAFLAATAYGVAWSTMPEIGRGALGQALGLTLLGAAPLFTCGTVIGGMGAVARSNLGRGMREPGAAAALGTGLGFVLTGLLLPRAPLPSSLLVGCMVLLSASGLAYGAGLGDGEDGKEEQSGEPDPVVGTPIADTIAPAGESQTT